MKRSPMKGVGVLFLVSLAIVVACAVGSVNSAYKSLDLGLSIYETTWPKFAGGCNAGIISEPECVTGRGLAESYYASHLRAVNMLQEYFLDESQTNKDNLRQALQEMNIRQGALQAYILPYIAEKEAK